MAYDKIIAIHTNLSRCVDYTLNHAKTGLCAALTYIENPAKNAAEGRDGLFHLESALNCELDTAYEDMQATKRRWGKDGPGHVLGYHLIHSYAPGEVTPQEAHAASLEFAQRLLGDRYEAVISTHLDRGHIHSHIVFNSVSFTDGKMYRNNFKDYFRGHTGHLQRSEPGARPVRHRARGERQILRRLERGKVR